MMLFRRLSLALAMATLSTVAGCGRFMHGGSGDEAQIVFVNQSLDQADVYVVGGAGQSQRIGTVFPGRTETLTIPSSVVASGGTVNIVARLLARSLAPRTGPITISGGQQLQVTLPPDERTLTILPAP